MALSVNADGEIKEVVATGKFPQFDVVGDESDHHYLHGNKSVKENGVKDPDCFSNASSEVHKKIMKEWRVLERNLPDSIYVRVYERRIDLLRAAIVGPAGTPYHDGLFFFDLAFPSDYPTRPPQVTYRSFGIRVNPNLYASGFVCLSLLNTWFGKAKEKWNPAESTVLQVLVSIQGLVLNREPYFNEPSVGHFPGQGKKSTAYSEKAFVMSCKTMVYLLRNPPKNFEDLVAWHFRERAQHIFAACNAYMEGRVKVGCYPETGLVSPSSRVHVSSNFKAMMKSWYPEMAVAFGISGASIGNFAEEVVVESNTSCFSGVGAKKEELATSSEADTGAKNKKIKLGIRKVIRKLKNVLGLKKVGEKESGGIKLNLAG